MESPIHRTNPIFIAVVCLALAACQVEQKEFTPKTTTPKIQTSPFGSITAQIIPKKENPKEPQARIRWKTDQNPKFYLLVKRQGTPTHLFPESMQGQTYALGDTQPHPDVYWIFFFHNGTGEWLDPNPITPKKTYTYALIPFWIQSPPPGWPETTPPEQDLIEAFSPPNEMSDEYLNLIDFKTRRSYVLQLSLTVE